MRRRAWLLFVLLLSMLAPLPALARTILILGDSLSAAYGIDARAGWVSLLEQRLARDKLDYRVVNASISGDTSANGLARLPPLLARHQPQVLVVALGGNDGLRGQAPEQMKHNIAAIIAKARGANAKVLVVGVPLPPNYGKPYLQRFQRAYADLAREQRVTLAPSMLEGIEPTSRFVQADGIHPTAAAQPLILDNIWPALRPLL